MTGAVSDDASLGRARLVSLEVRGFRAFGAEPRFLPLDEPLVVVHAGNSQGKTSLAEAIEFLISGRSSRRELLGGAKAEYNDSLRNAHLGDGDTDVYVEAVLRSADGVVHRVRRELISDFGRGVECESRLLLDDVEVDDLASLGVGLADPPVRAPVLLQHILRHVLSTEPKQRVGYFKALLSLTDLDRLRERVKAARVQIDAEEPGAVLRLVNASSDASIAQLAATMNSLTKKTASTTVTAETIHSALLETGHTIMANTPPHDGEQSDPGNADQISDASDRMATVDDLDLAVSGALDAQRERSFPLAPFNTNADAPHAPEAPDLTGYATTLAASDQQAARLAPMFEAVLAVGDYAELDEPRRCPVCGTEHALTPERVDLLREHLERTHAVDEEARSASQRLGDARRNLDRVAAGAKGSVPQVAGWDEERRARAEEMLGDLGTDVALLTTACVAASAVADGADAIDQTISRARIALDAATQAVSGRQPPPEELATQYQNIADAVQALADLSQTYADAANALSSAVEVATRDHPTVPGLAELAEILERRKELVADVIAEAERRKLVKRIAAAEKALREAAGEVLDGRFEQMSDTITDWWSSIRPERAGRLRRNQEARGGCAVREPHRGAARGGK